ncbi:MAG: S8 family serine peptidase [Bacteroidota bacterium]
MKSKKMFTLLSLAILLSFQVMGQPTKSDFSRSKNQVLLKRQQITKSKVDRRLLQMADDKSTENLNRGIAKKLDYFNPLSNNGKVKIKVILDQNFSESLGNELNKSGFEKSAAGGRVIVGAIPIKNLKLLESIDGIHKVKPVIDRGATLDVGVVDAEGDSAMFTNVLKEQSLTNGSGVKIGVISNSFNNLNGQQASVIAGDLPGPGNPNGFTTPIDIINDFPSFGGLTDEGRGMAELIHDVAPGAEIAFNNLETVSDANFAQAIDQLVAAGCDIIVDDLTVFVLPFFQDGLTSRAIDAATTSGVAYFSSAGNTGRTGVYESIGYNTTDIGVGIPVFDFDPDPNNENGFLSFEITAQSSINLTLQWDEPWFSLCDNCGGAQNELDFAFYLNGQFVDLLPADAIGGDAINRLTASFSGLNAGDTAVFSVVITQLVANQTTPGRLKLRNASQNARILSNIPFNLSPTSLGHKTAEGCIAVGAANFLNTPAFSTLPTAVVGFDGASFGATRTSVGGAPILFDNQGQRIPEVVREVPAFVGPDGSQTSFFGRVFSDSPFPRFSGTSASAPTVAAAAALLLQASGKTYSPAQIRDVLEQTSLDMDDPYNNGLQISPNDPLFATGYDFTTGFGFVRPLDAFNIVINDVGSEVIELDEVCSENPSSERRWKFTNPNGFALEVDINSSRNIRLPGETSFGSSSRTYNVPPGESFISTDLSSFSTSTFLSVTYRPVGSFGIGRISRSVRGSVNGCSQYARQGITNNNFTSSKQANIVYPNPSNDGKFFINIFSELNEDEALFRVFDISGREMKGTFVKPLSNGNNQIEIDLTSYAKGMYLLKINAHQLSESQRLLIE